MIDYTMAASASGKALAMIVFALVLGVFLLDGHRQNRSRGSGNQKSTR
jgi:hypothetical protein